MTNAMTRTMPLCEVKFPSQTTLSYMTHHLYWRISTRRTWYILNFYLSVLREAGLFGYFFTEVPWRKDLPYTMLQTGEKKKIRLFAYFLYCQILLYFILFWTPTHCDYIEFSIYNSKRITDNTHALQGKKAHQFTDKKSPSLEIKST